MTDAFPTAYPLFVDDREDADCVARSLHWCLLHRDALAPLGAALGRHLATVCDMKTAVIPRYLKILEHAEPPRVPSHPESLLASALTVDAYAMSVDGERWG